MPDKYAIITELDDGEQARIADRMELRGDDPRQRELLAAYVEAADLPPGSRVLEVGCGTGVVARYLADHPPVDSVVGVDPSPVLVERARNVTDDERVTFEEGDGQALRFEDASFDAVVMHTVTCHVPDTTRLLAESYRVLRPGGCLLAFDGDYRTTTVAVGDHDPLQRCVDAALDDLLEHPYVVRRLPQLAADAGFEVGDLRSHGYTKTTDPDYLLEVIAVGAEALVEAGTVRPALGEALEAEARDRVGDGSFYGFIEYASLDCRKPPA